MRRVSPRVERQGEGERERERGDRDNLLSSVVRDADAKLSSEDVAEMLAAAVVRMGGRRRLINPMLGAVPSSTPPPTSATPPQTPPSQHKQGAGGSQPATPSSCERLAPSRGVVLDFGREQGGAQNLQIDLGGAASPYYASEVSCYTWHDDAVDSKRHAQAHIHASALTWRETCKIFEQAHADNQEGTRSICLCMR